MKGGLEQQIRTLGRLLAVFASIFMLLIGFILFVNRYPNVFVGKEQYEEISEEQIPLIKVDDATIAQSGFGIVNCRHNLTFNKVPTNGPCRT